MRDKHDIIKLESDVKLQFENDRSDANMYTTIKRLTEGILVTKRLTTNSSETDEISHEVATDLYIKINKEDNPLIVYAWTKYIMRSIKGYIREYLKYNKYKEDIVIRDPIDRREFMRSSYGSLGLINTSGDLVDTINEIPMLIDEFYDKYIRYSKEYYKYKSTKISLVLSVYHGKVICYDDSDESLVRLLYNMLMKNISSKLFSYFDDIDRNFNFYYGSADSIKFSESEWSYGSRD